MRSFEIDQKQDVFFPFMYRGIVEHNIDPLKAGRVKLRIMGIHSDNRDSYVETKHLPWAVPSTSIGYGGARSIGNYQVPPIGSHLYCFFEQGDHNAPVYFACAPAIEDLEDYQEKDGKLDDSGKNGEFEYDEFYDERTNYDDEIDEFETEGGDEAPKYPVPDWCEPTRLNIHSETAPDPSGKPQKMIDPNQESDEEYEPRHIFPINFFLENIEEAFEGDVNSDAPGYSGENGTNPGSMPDDDRHLRKWDEKKWGHNDDEYDGDANWKPEYPMVSTFRNLQGEIEDRDVLKLRKTYIHPSKYYEEIVQLDAQYQEDDFWNEKSVKYTYEAQRGYQSHRKNKNNDLQYYNKEGSPEGRGPLQKFEKRIHNPGRERTINEDIVYRCFIDKVNITHGDPEEDENADLNVLFHKGNNNLEMKEGDINIRIHEGHENKFLDDGNRTYTLKDGHNRLYIDNGYDHLVIGGSREWGSPVQDEPPTGWQRFDIYNGDQEFILRNGNQLFDLWNGNQDFVLMNGNMYRGIYNGNYDRYVNGNSTVLANGKVTIKGETVHIQAGHIILDGPVTCTHYIVSPAFIGTHIGPVWPCPC